MAVYSLSETKDPSNWLYSGVNFNISGTGGQECVDFIAPRQKLLETLLACAISVAEIYFTYPKLKLPDKVPQMRSNDPWGKRILLVMLCLTYGIELGYKVSSRQLIWILNPCHVNTMVQIYLLMAPPSRTVMLVFRLSMHMFHGAAIAVLLPVVNTRHLPFEVGIYWLQHVLILLVPFYLLYLGGVYTPEPLSDFNWPVMSKGILFLYHWLLLQYISQVSHVNINNSLCPAVSDPFYGPYYRLVAMVHSGLLIVIYGKIYTYVSQWILPKRVVEESSDTDSATYSNGHAKST